jgi:predicted RNA binding protein YcfA (HicA-like mRNA interferase family)
VLYHLNLVRTRLPVIQGRELIKYLSKKGFKVTRIRGDHVVMQSANCRVTVPLHPELDRGTLLAILEEVGISREEFLSEWYA